MHAEIDMVDFVSHVLIHSFEIDENPAVHVCLLSENGFNSYCSKEMIKNKQNV